MAACHASVSQKLTAQLQVLSGTANGNANGEKNRQRPKQVIIVARDLNPQNNLTNNVPNNSTFHGPTMGELPNTNKTAVLSRKVVPCDPNSDEDDVFLHMQIQVRAFT